MSLHRHVAERLSERALPPLEKGRSASEASRVGIKRPAFAENDPHRNPALFKGREGAADAAPLHSIAAGLKVLTEGGSA